MTRARAAQLALVNWRGVFYERYELSDTVTALEGANGAGKTTVLIAAFVVLLPDMNHLRFTNIGDHGATAGDRGVWGRLGETGRPSYAVLDIELASGDRLVAGVHLERRSEPAVEATPFFVTGLRPDDELQDLLLLRENDLDSIPHLGELQEQVARFGARLQRCTTAKEYFAGLFERGVTPLRLDGDAERGKLADMLRTSMTGGMSRVLTSSLREFLLKEERGLADTLKRMRLNIDACRRTRSQVEETQKVEGEVSSVYEAGQAMFNAALHATEQAAQEARNRVGEAESAVRGSTQAVTTTKANLETARRDHEQIAQRLRALDLVLDRERGRCDRLERGLALRKRVDDEERAFAAVCAAKGWAVNLSSPQDINEFRRDLNAQRDHARDDRKRCEEGKQACEAEQRRLSAAGGALSEPLLALSRALGGKLLASKFEDISIEHAGAQEARLGPLAQAIVVDDPASAARGIPNVADRPDSVWLVGLGAVPHTEAGTAPAEQVVGDDVIVRSSENVWRVSRIPERPVLGRRARQTKLEEFQSEAARFAREAERHLGRQSEIEGTLRSVDDLVSRMKAVERDRDDLTRLNVGDVNDSAVADTRKRVDECRQKRREADDQRVDLARQEGKRAAELRQAEQALKSAQTGLEQEKATFGPAQQRWEMLRAAADADDLLGAASQPEVVERLQSRGSGNLYRDAFSSARVLHERLAGADDGAETARTIDALCRLDDRSGDDYLCAWRDVRVWLHRRIPAQIAQMDDPLEALMRLRTHLAGLRERLRVQERDLQGESAGVANAIGTQTRQARRDVARLNDDLRQVRFGSIAGVRLQLRRVPRMENILEALRKGEDQGRLFTPDIPLEDALDQLFTKFGGRRTQGHKLLDYRQYVDPCIEVRRQAGSGWEVANPNRISTGESIGIGAALMMVVLTAWERSASLLRTQRAHGTLRLLLLDEANRLDRDNLGVLFDLCRSLDLQLLVAAPEVAQAQGNTTYRLVRESDGNGCEEVRVTGRRMVAGEAA